jgi:hypothetical protein
MLNNVQRYNELYKNDLISKKMKDSIIITYTAHYK